MYKIYNCVRSMSGTKITKYHFSVLCRLKRCIPKSAPTEPNIHAKKSKNFSGILYSFLFAKNLSILNKIKLKVLINSNIVILFATKYSFKF